MRDSLKAKGTEGGFPDLSGEMAYTSELRQFLAKSFPGKKLPIEFGPETLLPWPNSSALIKKRLQLKYSRAEHDADASAEPLVENDIQQASTASSEEDRIAASPHQPNAAAWVVTQPKSECPGCLHAVGRCYRTPGVHYSDWVEVTESVPPGSYGKACKQCFPLGFPIITYVHLESVASKTEGNWQYYTI